MDMHVFDNHLGDQMLMDVIRSFPPMIRREGSISVARSEQLSHGDAWDEEGGRLEGNPVCSTVVTRKSYRESAVALSVRLSCQRRRYL